MASEEIAAIPTYTIIQADGLYQDDSIEQEILKSTNPAHPYKINYLETNLSPAGVPTYKPWTTIEKSLRDKVNGISILKPDFTAADLDLFPSLKVLVRMGVGYDRVDRVALAKRGVTLCNVPDYGTCEIADHAVALALSLRRGIILHHDKQRGNPPAEWTYIETPLVSRIQGATFGVLGLGLIGTAVALRAKAFGWNVLVYDPFVPNGVDKSFGVERTRDLKALFQRSTTVSVHCPSTPQTQKLVGYELLSLMPKGGILINTSRGEVVNLDDVERCLRQGILAGVGLDVVPDEPIPVEGPVHPLLQAYRDQEDWLVGRMAVTPHSAYHSPESLFDIRVKTAETMRDVLINGLKVNIIQPPKE
ncbi:C-terminal binding protein [Aspergillus karnatakaensis]|uniref:C-terminal binding protein n=1 Tax=Aspergillus karnatakaensis TaxID=1810916 RepID=UPI003CCCA3C3